MIISRATMAGPLVSRLPHARELFAANHVALAWYLDHSFEIIGGGFAALRRRRVVEIHPRRTVSDSGGVLGWASARPSLIVASTRVIS
jgi:hypothetical protein